MDGCNYAAEVVEAQGEVSGICEAVHDEEAILEEAPYIGEVSVREEKFSRRSGCAFGFVLPYNTMFPLAFSGGGSTT
jgi:hypothetical protein